MGAPLFHRVVDPGWRLAYISDPMAKKTPKSAAKIPAGYEQVSVVFPSQVIDAFRRLCEERGYTQKGRLAYLVRQDLVAHGYQIEK